jgi:phosphohistidine swiveling domain-containing protein
MNVGSRYVVSIRDVAASDIPLVGGKGANLGELVGAGLPVPEAFCVTTDAYRAFIDANALQDPILAELDSCNYEDVVDLGRRGSAIRERIIAAAMPQAIESQIRENYIKLEAAFGSALPVSVRSSATAEDLPGTSFAGQQDTYLHISGIDAVLEHIKKCWGSLWTDRAISYRQRQGFRHEDVLLAVVVQEMFPSDVAGVMFTANPVTSNPDEVFINASWGLGEAVVSGQVNPDQYIVAKGSFDLREKLIHDKKIMTVRREDGQGSHEADVPEALRNVETLTDEQIQDLTRIGLGIEEHYGFPQDIEWGYSNGRFAILQSREITAADLDFGEGLEQFLSPEARADLTNERWIWSRGHSDETQTGPSSPYHYSVLERRMTLLKYRMLWYTDQQEFIGFKKEDFEKIPMYRWYGARAYYNLEVEKERIRRFIPPFARDDQALWPFPVNEREEIRKMAFNWPQFLSTMLRLHFTHPTYSLLQTPGFIFENMEKWTDWTAEQWAKVDMETMTATELFDYEIYAKGDSKFLENAALPFTIYLYVLPAALRGLCKIWLGDENQAIYGALISGLSTKTGEENLAIWDLAKTLRQQPEVAKIASSDASGEEILAQVRAHPDAAAFLEHMDRFIAQNGHRGGAERDAYHPRYRHKPSNIFNALKPMLKLDDAHSPEVHERQLAERMEKTKAECVAKLQGMDMGFLRAPFFSWLTDLTQQYYYYRDFERFYNDRDMSRPRDFLTVIAKQFLERGLIEDKDDIFFLGREEILQADQEKMSARDVGHRVRSRRRVYDRYRQKEPPKYLQGWRTFDDDQLADDGRGLRGIAASSGTVTGRARVCRNLDEISKIEKGDILVTVATDPGWTTVFSIIGGVVVETGGVVAHAVMISREYGIPCVANLTRACDQIPDGATITVDGGTGRVVIHEDA